MMKKKRRSIIFWLCAIGLGILGGFVVLEESNRRDVFRRYSKMIPPPEPPPAPMAPIEEGPNLELILEAIAQNEVYEATVVEDSLLEDLLFSIDELATKAGTEIAFREGISTLSIKTIRFLQHANLEPHSFKLLLLNYEFSLVTRDVVWNEEKVLRELGYLNDRKTYLTKLQQNKSK